MDKLYGSFKDYVIRHRLMDEKSSIVAAVSGGIDSMTLLHLLGRLAEEWEIKVLVAHLNHGLRGIEADRDEKFVKETARNSQFGFFVQRTDTRTKSLRLKLSIQETARNIRYSFLEKVRQKQKADVIATAHNANDNAETVLMNLIRGTGIDGAAGIPPKRNDAPIIRPLLFAERKEIAAYVLQHGIEYREDSSNAGQKYSRNFIRHAVIPLLEKRLNPSTVRTISDSAEIFRQNAEFVHRCVEKIMQTAVRHEDHTIVIHQRSFLRQPVFLRNMVLHQLLAASHIEPSFPVITALHRLFAKENGTVIDLGKGSTGSKERGMVILSKKRTVRSFRFCLEKPGKIDGHEFSIEASMMNGVSGAAFNRAWSTRNEEYFDAAKVLFPLHIRSWKRGDSFNPLGMNSKKKLSDFFIDNKFSDEQKKTVPLIISNNIIVWVAGHRISDLAKVTRKTNSILKISLTKHISY